MYNALKYAQTLARHGNYRRAAQALGISQSQLSRAIQSLEKELGLELFVRNRQGVSIAPEGKLVLDEAAILLKAEDAFTASVARIRNRSDQELRVGVGAYVSQSWLPAAIAETAATHPAISISTSELDWWTLPDAVLSDAFHLVVGEIGEAEQVPDIVIERFPEREGMFFVRAGHPLDGHDRVTLEHIATFPLAAPRLPARVSQFLPTGSKLGHVSDNGRYFLPVIETATPRAVIDVVLASDAVGITLRAIGAEQLISGAIVELPLHTPWLRTRQTIMYLRGRPLSHAAMVFRTKAKVAERKYFRDVVLP